LVGATSTFVFFVLISNPYSHDTVLSPVYPKDHYCYYDYFWFEGPPAGLTCYDEGFIDWLNENGY